MTAAIGATVRCAVSASMRRTAMERLIITAAAGAAPAGGRGA
jgi:hypothetical protein